MTQAPVDFPALFRASLRGGSAPTKADFPSLPVAVLLLRVLAGAACGLALAALQARGFVAFVAAAAAILSAGYAFFALWLQADINSFSLPAASEAEGKPASAPPPVNIYSVGLWEGCAACLLMWGALMH